MKIICCLPNRWSGKIVNLKKLKNRHFEPEIEKWSQNVEISENWKIENLKNPSINPKIETKNEVEKTKNWKVQKSKNPTRKIQKPKSKSRNIKKSNNRKNETENSENRKIRKLQSKSRKLKNEKSKIWRTHRLIGKLKNR